MNLDDNTCYKLRDKFYFQKGGKKNESENVRFENK